MGHPGTILLRVCHLLRQGKFRRDEVASGKFRAWQVAKLQHRRVRAGPEDQDGYPHSTPQDLFPLGVAQGGTLLRG